jgi:hypothetical protein
MPIVTRATFRAIGGWPKSFIQSHMDVTLASGSTPGKGRG